ncbi:cyclic nucleotide-binding protein, partial [Corallococcus exiguus]|nr:cyclic nucleotide-binding protein [Corallococcus exiguus]
MESRALKDKATEAFGKGRFAKAAELYEDYCQAEPKDHQSRLRMGDAWSKAGQRDRAVSAYQSAAEGFAKEGFLPRAIAASKLILELDPSHQGVQQMLADLYARRGTPATSRAKPKDAAPPSTPASLITPREVSPETTSPRPVPPEPLEAGGAPVDLSDALPPELALSNAPVADDTEVVLSVEVELEPTQDEPKAPTVTEAAAPPPAVPAPAGQSVRVAPPSPSPMPELPQLRTPSGRWQALAPPITGPETTPAPTAPK